MSLTIDHRSFISFDEKQQHCVCCDKDLVLLPNDRRGGYCFDCLTLEDSGWDRCPECRSALHPENQHSYCPVCGWTTHSCWRG